MSGDPSGPAELVIVCKVCREPIEDVSEGSLPIMQKYDGGHGTARIHVGHDVPDGWSRGWPTPHLR